MPFYDVVMCGAWETGKWDLLVLGKKRSFKRKLREHGCDISVMQEV